MASPKSDVMKALGGDPCPKCGEFVELTGRVQGAFFRWAWACQACHMEELHRASRHVKKESRRRRDHLRMMGIDVGGDD